MQLKDLGERCELPIRVRGRALAKNVFRTILAPRNCIKFCVFAVQKNKRQFWAPWTRFPRIVGSVESVVTPLNRV